MATSDIAADLDITIRTETYPQRVLVKLGRARATRLGGLDGGAIPIFPAKFSMQIILKRKTKTVTRFQHPIAAACCFTDYHSRGQTIPRIIVDIAFPPTSKLSLSNLYLALSKSLGQGTIKLLQEFDY